MDLAYKFYFLRQNWHKYSASEFWRYSYPLTLKENALNTLIISTIHEDPNILNKYSEELLQNFKNDEKVSFFDKIEFQKIIFEENEFKIYSRSFFIKILDCLLQNWAVIDTTEEKVRIFFINENSNVYDVIETSTSYNAVGLLFKNGFTRYIDFYRENLTYPFPPEGPYFQYFENPIYSSGKFFIN